MLPLKLELETIDSNLLFHYLQVLHMDLGQATIVSRHEIDNRNGRYLAETQ